MAVTSAEGATRPRRWPRRLLVGLSVLVAVGLIAGLAGYGYFRWQFSRIHKLDIPIGRGRADTGGVLRADEKGEPMNVLLVGSDSRSNLQGADCQRNCRDESGQLITGQRSDTIMLLRADPQNNRAAILSIPRDLWVHIAGTNHSARINSAFENGPQQLIRTITEGLGIEINHYAEVDFVGFRNLVNAVGGVPIYVPAPARDFYSDLRVPTAGCVTLTGDQALAWVRSRHYEYYEAAGWRSDPRSDFGRILRQQDFIRRLMKRSIAQGIRNPVTLNRLIGIAVDNLTIDSAMSSRDILSLGDRFRSLDPESVAMYTLPTVDTTIGGADVLRIKQPEANRIIDEFNGDRSGGEQPPAGILPNSVRIRTLNGSGQNGVASKTAGELESMGFQNAGAGDADQFTYARTILKYGKGQRDKALLVQSYLGSGARLQEDMALTVDVVLILGQDFSGVTRPASEGQSSSTVPSTSSTSRPESPVPIPRGAPQQPQC